MQQAEISIVYVNYKTPELLCDSIASVITYTRVAFEIIVVDNASEDNSEQIVLSRFPDVRWINAGYNSGFARGNNIGIAAATGRYVLILNSDTILREDAIGKSFEQYKLLEQNEKLGLLGCKICSFSGYVLPSVHDSFPSIADLWKANALYIYLNRGKEREEKDRDAIYNHNHFAAHISGAFMLFNKQRLNSKALWLDEDFFLYSEDVEWCYRLAKQGYKHYFLSDSTIYHLDSGSSPDSERKTNQVTISKWLFIYKAYGRMYLNVYVQLQRLNILMDSILYRRNLNRATPQQHTDHKKRAVVRELLHKYVPIILKDFKLVPSGSKAFFKYD